MFVVCILGRSLLQPRSAERNMVGASQHYCDVIPPVVAKNILSEKRFKKAREQCVDRFLQSSCLDTEDVQSTMDKVGISRQSYTQLFKVIQGKLKQSKVKSSLLPKPSYVQQARHNINSRVMEVLGEPFHIIDTYPRKKKELKFNSFNNIFFYLRTLQRAMIKFYELIHEEVNGVAIFVLKLDECELLKGRKLERVSITLMNRALQEREGDQGKKDPGHFSVESEQHIWWLGAFEVDFGFQYLELGFSTHLYT